jgi:perosamine synthetase
MSNNFLPVSKPLLTQDDIRAVNQSLRDGWISSEGPNVEKFEKNFSNYIGKRYSVAVSNGTAALEIAIKSLKLKKKDEIIIPNFTIISNPLAAIKQNVKIKLIDCDLLNWNMNYEKVVNSITSKTKAIIVTHIYNYPFRIDKLKKYCKKKNIWIIEDAAEVLGQYLNKKKCGSFGDISTFSFYSNKQITTGEGGMISTNNKKLYDKFKSLRNLCFGKEDRFNHSDIGWNYRMTNIQATLGISQLKRIDTIVKERHRIGNIYYKFLKESKNIYIPQPSNNYSKNIYWVVGILVNKNKNLTAKKIIKKLFDEKIGSRPFFWPISNQDVFKTYPFYNPNKFKNSNYLSKYGLYLPNYLGMKKSDILYVCNKLKKIVNAS